MPLHAKHAGVWKVAKAAFAKHAGVWKSMVGVWAKRNGAWSQLGGALSGASASDSDGSCVYFPPQSGCTSEGTATAYPINGWAPFTYQWYVVAKTTYVDMYDLTSKTCRAAQFQSWHYVGYADVYCVVTDATGAQATTNTVRINLQQTDGNL